jgi:hypothetical protein
MESRGILKFSRPCSNPPATPKIFRFANCRWLPRTDEAYSELVERRIGHGIQHLAPVLHDDPLSCETPGAARPASETDRLGPGVFTENILGGEKVDADLGELRSHSCKQSARDNSDVHTPVYPAVFAVMATIGV